MNSCLFLSAYIFNSEIEKSEINILAFGNRSEFFWYAKFTNKFTNKWVNMYFAALWPQLLSKNPVSLF